MSKLLDELKRAMEADGRSRYRIAKDSGLTEAALSRLVSGERGLSVESAERLADVLDLKITLISKRKDER
ncbi:MAG: helix-turn-helix transcriptional regulator [Planctomycetes bacterium]|nr:helix-turn-helix transcriptional regulator [Planctomycetota bacterium]